MTFYQNNFDEKEESAAPTALIGIFFNIYGYYQTFGPMGLLHTFLYHSFNPYAVWNRHQMLFFNAWYWFYLKHIMPQP